MFAFCVVTINDEHKKSRFLRKRRGFAQNFEFKATGIFVILLSLNSFKCNPETKFQTNTS